jgi:hypothetical protein
MNVVRGVLAGLLVAAAFAAAGAALERRSSPSPFPVPAVRARDWRHYRPMSTG